MLNQTLMNDAQVREDVLREMRLDSRLKGVEIGVAVCDGTVTLTGRVGSTTETLAALEAARRSERVVPPPAGVANVDDEPVRHAPPLGRRRGRHATLPALDRGRQRGRP